MKATRRWAIAGILGALAAALVGCGSQAVASGLQIGRADERPLALPKAVSASALPTATPAGAPALPADAAASPEPAASGTLAALPPDRGTPPAYPDAAHRTDAEALLRAQEAASIAPVLSPDARRVIADLDALGVAHLDLWHGSHLLMTGDHGAYYRAWAAHARAATKRFSSHASHDPQFELPVGFRDGGILIGTSEPAGDTWLQFERHAMHEQPTDQVGKVVGILKNLHSAHGEDYMIYRRTHENVGPLGLSPHTDQTPLVIALPAGAHPAP